jgi:hypothetical protein
MLKQPRWISVPKAIAIVSGLTSEARCASYCSSATCNRTLRSCHHDDATPTLQGLNLVMKRRRIEPSTTAAAVPADVEEKKRKKEKYKRKKEARERKAAGRWISSQVSSETLQEVEFLCTVVPAAGQMINAGGVWCDPQGRPTKARGKQGAGSADSKKGGCIASLAGNCTNCIVEDLLRVAQDMVERQVSCTAAALGYCMDDSIGGS